LSKECTLESTKTKKNALKVLPLGNFAYFCSKIRKIIQIKLIMLAEQGKYIFGVVKVGERGQIVIPKEAREVYSIKAGDSLLVLGDSKGMAVLKTEIFQDKIDEMLGEG